MKKTIDDTISPKQRTTQQNRALHKYFELLAETLNDAGLDMRAVLKPEVEIPWSKMTIKEFLWKPVLKVYLGKRSTADMTTKELDEVYDIVNRHLAKHGVHIPFPSIENFYDNGTNQTIRQNVAD